jgi:hypothetical protein
MKDNIVGGCLGAVIVAVFGIIFGPALCYFFGWITGNLLSWVIGDMVVNGMNYLFNTDRFTVDMLPTICGTLGVIGSFFKNATTTSSNR